MVKKVKRIASNFVVVVFALGGAVDATAGEYHGFSNRPLPLPEYQFNPPQEQKAELGRLLMFDKILSGNRNISCGTCHHSLTDSGDGLSLPVGEGGAGLGVTRLAWHENDSISERVPRNAPPVWNLGDASFHTLFHDGRVTTRQDEGADVYPSGCKTPAGFTLPDNLENILACQAMFPVTSATEMAGQHPENAVASAAEAGDLPLVWELLAQRLRRIPEYVTLFQAAFPEQVLHAEDITFAHAANAIAAFESTAWRADNSPFDRYIRGDRDAMSRNAERGMILFYKGVQKSAACADCHSGLYQTDQAYHAIAMPQIGPGRGSNGPGLTSGHEDFGRQQVTGNPADTLKFRTPSLRNVALTAPYGHSGAYNSLRGVVEHHIEPLRSLYKYNDDRQAILPTHPLLDAENYRAMDNPDIVDFIALHNELQPMAYGHEQIDLILEFLHALTDPASLDLRSDLDVVNGVPSGLPLDE